MLILIPGKKRGMNMIRVRLGNDIYTTKKVYGISSCNTITFFDSGDQYIITLKNRDKVEEILDQVCRNGFADFSKEDIKVIIK